MAPRLSALAQRTVLAIPRSAKVAVAALSGAALAVIGVALVVKWAPQWLASTGGLKPVDRAAEIGRVRTSLLAVLAGGIGIVGAIYTGRTFALNRQGQITERFTRAVDQLGSSQIDVRLGGIYALQRLAQESAVDHPPIMEILTGFLREHSVGSGNHLRTGTDIQAALSVVAQRRIEHDGPRPLSLRDADLHGGEFHGTTLIGVDFWKANLTSAYLQRATLRKAKITSADLTSAWMDDADLEGAILMFSNLAETRLPGANLKGAKFYDAKLKKTRLQRADLRGADFGGATLEELYLEGAVYDDSTVWPEGFSPPDGAIRQP
jgi:hypothetical protein